MGTLRPLQPAEPLYIGWFSLRPQYLCLICNEPIPHTTRLITCEMTTSYSIGDPVRISDSPDTSFVAVVVGTPRNGIVEVQKLEKGVDLMYRIGSQCYNVEHSSILEHYDLHGDDGNAPRAFDKLGFRMIDGSTFVKHTDEQGDRLFPVGNGEFDLISSDDDDEDTNSLDDFIVPDDECEPFSFAEESSDFVKETHAAVRAFNGWVPANEQEAQARSFMIRQEARAIQIDDEARFSRGIPGISYSTPGQ